jgi:hypothetical protein
MAAAAATTGQTAAVTDRTMAVRSTISQDTMDLQMTGTDRKGETQSTEPESSNSLKRKSAASEVSQEKSHTRTSSKKKSKEVSTGIRFKVRNPQWAYLHLEL